MEREDRARSLARLAPHYISYLPPAPGISLAGVKSVDASVVTRIVKVVHSTGGEGGNSVADLIKRLRRAGLGPRLRRSKKVRVRSGDTGSVCSESTSAASGSDASRAGGGVSKTEIICDGICCASEVPIVNKTLNA